MQCRIGWAFGLLPAEVLSIPASQYRMLELYWEEEPWGPWRDNIHAAVIAREVMRSGGFKVPNAEVFMLKKPATAKTATSGKRAVIDMLKSISVRKKKVKAP